MHEKTLLSLMNQPAQKLSKDSQILPVILRKTSDPLKHKGKSTGHNVSGPEKIFFKFAGSCCRET